MGGSVRKDFRRDPSTGEQVWRGTWLYVLDLPAGPDGRRRQERRRGFATKTAAVAAMEEARARARGGVPGAPAGPVRSAAGGGSPTLAEYALGWLEEIRPTVAITAWASYRSVMRIYVLPWIGSRPLCEVTEDVLSGLYRDLLARGGHRRCRDCHPPTCPAGQPLSATTVRIVHRVLHRLFGDARKLVPVNPTVGARRPRRAARMMSVWTEEEVVTNLRALSGDRLYAAWFLAVTCGLRRGELAGLQWGDIDLARGTLSVRRQRTTADWAVVEKEPKGTSRRTVALGQATVEVLRAHRERQDVERCAAGPAWSPTGYVFVTELGKPIHPGDLTKRFQAACRSVGARVIRLHEIRHTCATLALAANVHPKVVQERLGHSSIQITLDTYSHTMPSMQTQAATAIESFITGCS